MLSRKATNTNFIVFGLNRSGLEPVHPRSTTLETSTLTITQPMWLYFRMKFDKRMVLVIVSGFYCWLLLFILLFGMVSQKFNIDLWIFISGGQVAVDSADFDFTLLYKLIRNLLTAIPAPTCGWGNQPLPGHLNETDDIERIRHLRNNLAHNSEFEICDTDFSTHWTDLSLVK